MTGYINKMLGVTLNGRDVHDIQVSDKRMYKEVLLKGSLGLGDSYVKGYWDARDLYAFHLKVLTSPLARRLSGSIWPHDIAGLIKEKLSFVSTKKAKVNIAFHYDIGSDFYRVMLGETMQYTSAYFANSEATLDESQQRKFALVADKLKVFAGCRVLEIGCGWGNMANYLAEQKGCRVVAVTISQEQYRYCLAHNGRPANGSVEFVLADFRETAKYVGKVPCEKFDRIVGIGTIAHFVPMFKSLVNIIVAHLKGGGLALLDDVCRDATCRSFVPSQSSWISKNIFPGTQFFSPDKITKYFRNKLIIERWSTDREQYRDTCLAWLNNIDSGWDSIREMGDYDEKFYRIWKYYLTCAAAAFEAGYLGQWQILLSKMSHPYTENPRSNSTPILSGS